MADDPKPPPESGHAWMRKALEEEERSEHGLSPEPPVDEVKPAGGPARRER